ncbi:MAG: IS200/IS605 family transposase, partial [Planctomycetota bacterium]|nr:IS200/IS605 family transposase [Planctomycetota bacterium]
MAECRRGSRTVHDIKYHLVWVTKYRYPVFQGDVGSAARTIIRRVREERDAILVKGHVSRDHIHLPGSTPPNVAPSDLVRAVKG